MNFDELDSKFPNGFDDAEITCLTVDYEKHTATFQLNMRGNSCDSPGRDVYSRSVLTAHGVHYVSIEPPDAEHMLETQHQKITVDGLPEGSRNFPLFEWIKPRVSDDRFFCRFFVHDWNSFIHIGASDADFSWLSDRQAE